jgi:(S)-ureidoglycine aminohydrolase
LTGRAVFTDAYAVIAKGVIRDIVASYLPYWDNARVWVLARPLSGFAETFSHYLIDVAPGGGSELPEPDTEAEGALFVVGGKMTLRLNGTEHVLRPGGLHIFLPSAAGACRTAVPMQCNFIGSGLYQSVPGLAAPEAIVTNEGSIAPTPMPDTEGRWATTRFVEPSDIRHDMHITIVTFEPGASIPFAETHVMEHGLYVLEGKAVYRLDAIGEAQAAATARDRFALDAGQGLEWRPVNERH